MQCLRAVFTVEPESTAAALGSDVVLSCSATALDVGGQRLAAISLSYAWTLDGRSVPREALQFVNHSLYIPTITTADVGLYCCHVTCNSSTASSRNATVVIACNNTYLLTYLLTYYRLQFYCVHDS